MIKRLKVGGAEIEIVVSSSGDFVTYEDHAAEVARMSDLLATSQKEGMRLAGLLNGQESAISRLNEQVRALAAENKSMRELLGAVGYKSETPATNATLNEVRAQAVAGLADHIDSLDEKMMVSSTSIRGYAAHIRAGEV